MVRSLRLPRFAAALSVVPLAAYLSAACGGDNTQDFGDSGPDARALDGSLQDGRALSDATLPDDDASDTDPDANLSDANQADANQADTGVHTDAGVADADADARSDGEAGLDAAPDADAGDGGLGLLGKATKFAVLAGSAVAVTPSPPNASTTIIGDVGVAPGTAIATFLHPVGNNHAGDTTALEAQGDLTTAYSNLAGRQCIAANIRSGVDLGGKTLKPGVYCFPNTTAQITGDLVLDAELDPNAVWVIQVGSSLTTATNATVKVINGGSACNVYWQIGASATLGTGTKLVGNIVALTSITLVTGATVAVGRTLALNGAVTLDANTVSSATCQ